MTRASEPWQHGATGARATDVDPGERISVLRALFDAANGELDDCIETIDRALDDDESAPAPSVPG
jgi:hypothetical protein